MTDPTRILEIEARAEKATEGPWDTLAGSCVRAIRGDLAVPLFDVRLPLAAYVKTRRTHKAVCQAARDEVNNCHFVAHAREDIPYLLTTLRASEARVARLEEALKEIDAMPYYTEPVPPDYVTGLVRRFNKALDIARQALG